MKRFQFRLQKVLDHRDRIRDERRQELVRANSARDQAIQHLEELREEALNVGLDGPGIDPAPSSGSGVTSRAATKIVTIEQVTLLSDYARRLKAEIEKQVLIVEEASKQADIAREAYVEASQDTRALESLKEKRRLDHSELALKESEQSMDEMTVQRFKPRS